MGKKWTIIGGGSVRTPFFANSLAKRAKALHVSTLCLYDTDPEKLRIIGSIARHAAHNIDPELNVVLETDLTRAIAGTDYFVTTIRVGGDHSRVVDEQIAQKNGVLGQETTGAGGFFMAARSIPVLAEYCEKIRELAPNAWIFNFTNPSGLVAQAMRTLGYDRVIGICDTPSSTKLRIAEAMGYDNDRFTLDFFGLNHLSWARDAEYEGRHVMKDILSDEELPKKVGELAMFEPDLIRLIGHIPNEYLYYYYYRDKTVGNIQKAGTTRGLSVEENNIRMLAELKELDLEQEADKAQEIYLRHMYSREASYMQIETSKKVMHTPEALVMPEGEGYAGIAMEFASAIESGKSRSVVLSVPNNGSIEGLADSDVVEITCTVDQDGAHPVHIGKTAPEIYSLIVSVKAYERLSVEAILNGSKDAAVKALIAHPLIGSYSVAKSLVEDFCQMQGQYVQHWR